MRVKNKCAYEGCKEQFERKSSTQKYCSMACQQKARYDRVKTEFLFLDKECLRCEEKFTGRAQSRYCPRCVAEKYLERNHKHNSVDGAGIPFSLNFDPYQSPEFLKTWEGWRVPDFVRGF